MATILCETAVLVVKEQRHCGLCGAAGHNRRTCALAPPALAPPAQAQEPKKEEVVFWSPDLFSGGGVKALPAAVAWAPGTDSIAFHAQMKSLPFYRYDTEVKLWRRA